MRVRLFYHDRCFDGACSAAVFSDFFRSQVDPRAEFVLSGLFHRPHQLFEEEAFDGDENVIVDFKYCSSPRVTWWFDHHQSAFLSAEDEQHFRADTSGQKLYDPTYASCTKFIADQAQQKFGYDASHLEGLIYWADIIDGAKYESAQSAVELDSAATQLTLVFEAAADNMTARVIPLMATHSLEEIIELPGIKESFNALHARHLESMEIIRSRAVRHDSVIYFDLADTDLSGYNKFIPYYLFPDCTYTVSVSDAGFRTKVSVGSNPWSPADPGHNLASICERYGGGGHPRVGAISYPKGELGRARQTAREIVQKLSQPRA